MKHQDDLKAIAKATKAIAAGLNDPGIMSPSYDIEGAAFEMATNGEAHTNNAFIKATAMAARAKADMLHACILLAQEVEKLEAKTKDACKRINSEASKMAQSLAKTKEMMGPQVEERLRQMERLLDCMERMQALEADGTFSRYMLALKK